MSAETTRPLRFSLRTLVIAFLIVNAVASGCVLFYTTYIAGQSRTRAEWDHSLTLPSSARNFQCKGEALLPVPDKDAYTLFEVDRGEVDAFIKSLNVQSEYSLLGAGPVPPEKGIIFWYGIPSIGTTPKWQPYQLSSGRPLFWNVTWQGNPQPVRVLHCRVPHGGGSWLQLTEWLLDDRALIQLHTNWN